MYLFIYFHLCEDSPQIIIIYFVSDREETIPQRSSEKINVNNYSKVVKYQQKRYFSTTLR